MVAYTYDPTTHEAKAGDLPRVGGPRQAKAVVRSCFNREMTLSMVMSTVVSALGWWKQKNLPKFKACLHNEFQASQGYPISLQ